MTMTLNGSGTGTVGVPNSATAQNSTSGTSIDFTGIPAGTKRITVMLNGVSTNGTSIPQMQLGVGSSPTTSGYVAMASYLSTTSNTTRGATASTGFIFSYANAAATETYYGSVVFTLLGSNTWTCAGLLYDSAGVGITNLVGSISLAGTLGMVRVTTVNGTDAFDAGSINILYE